jgi:sigma-B regulation protein RsbU (phosphoserine phosphatase)
VLALALLAFMLLPLANTDLQMVRGMGGSITRAIGALREGAQQFGEGKLAHRIPIAGDDDLWDTARQFNRMAEGLERARELEKQRDRMEAELDLARRIQARLLPAAPPRVPGLDVAGLSESAREVGGDYYDHLELGGGRLLLVIADVSGKGVPAALLMSGFRAALMSQDLARSEPEAIAGRVNEFLNQSVEPGKFVTAFIGVLDAASGRLAYVNAGHNPPVVVRAGGEVELLETGGVILGIMPGARYASGEATLAQGDLVALYTDGVTEGADATNAMWGEERLTALLRSATTAVASDIASRIVRAVRAFEGERGPADDITVLVARRVESVAG